MTTKEARQALERARRLEAGIRRRQMEIAELRASLLPSAVRYDREPVQVSPVDPIPEVMARIAELEDVITDLRLELSSELVRISRMIDSVQDGLGAEILTRFYIRRQKAEEIADALGYTVQWIYVLRNRAIAKIAESGDDNGAKL